jgi:hypothetical protein
LPAGAIAEHPAVRNSLVPLVAAIVLFAGGLLLIRPTVDRGQGGPEVNAGILRLPKRDPIRTAAAPLAGTTVARLEQGARDDGLWRVVVVAGDDRQPTTRAAMLALGEALFAAGMIAVMDPVLAAAEPTPPLPLPADRVIRVATREAEIAATPAGVWRARVAFSISEPRLAAGHPAEALLPPPAMGATVVVVEHEGQPTAGEAPAWPERWAATGRGIVQAMFGALLPPSGLRKPDALAADWGSALPFPPTTPEMRWSGAFQHDLVRGWSGRISGRTVATKSGEREAAAAPLLRLLPRGSWQPAPDEGRWQQWSRLRDGQLQRFAIRDEGDGWTCSMWVERADVAGLVDGWLIAATSGDAAAAAHLRRLLATPGLPEAQRVRIEQAAR